MEPTGFVSLVRDRLGEDRAESIQFRVDNERRLVQRAWIRPLLGWGRYGRSFGFDEEGHLAAIPDSLWIITFGGTGFCASSAWACCWRGLRCSCAGPSAPGDGATPPSPRPPWSRWRCSLWAVDDVFNAMLSPLFVAIPGALTSFRGVVADARAFRRSPHRKRPASSWPVAAQARAATPVSPRGSSGKGIP